MYNILDFHLIQIIESYSSNIPYWKNRFTQDVLPLLDQGYRLIGHECENCYIFGENDCYDHDNNIDLSLNFVSFNEFKQNTNSSIKFWSFEHFNTIFGLGEYEEWHLIKQEWYFTWDVSNKEGYNGFPNQVQNLNPLRLAILNNKVFKNQKVTKKELGLCDNEFELSTSITFKRCSYLTDWYEYSYESL
jgi:hypothetical protein